MSAFGSSEPTVNDNPYEPPQTASPSTSSPPFSLRRLLVAITMACAGATLLLAVRYPPSFDAFSPVGAGTFAVVLLGAAVGVVFGARRWIVVGASVGFVIATILWFVFYGVTPADLIFCLRP